MAARCGWAGHAVNPPPGSGPAAGGCAFGRLRSSASQAKRPHPWGLDGAIHGANGPAPPTRPASDSFRVRPATEKKKENQNQTPVASLLVSTKVDTHQFVMIRAEQGRHLQPSQFSSPTVTGKLSGVGRCRVAGCPRHGCRGQAPKDGFTASPQPDTAPTNKQKSQSRFGSGFCCGT